MAHLAHYKEAHPLVVVVIHWVNLICMFLLIGTGFYIHYPFLPLWMGVCRGVHILCGVVITFDFILRVILAFFIKSSPVSGTRAVTRDALTWWPFLPQRDDRHTFVEEVKYYLFLKKEHPLNSKYGIMQKISYMLLVPGFILMAWTGFSLMAPTNEWGVCQILIQGIGLMNIRILHYVLMYVTIIFLCIHIYLASIEGLAPIKLMFFRKEHPGMVYDPEKRNIVGYDGMGEKPSYGEAPRSGQLSDDGTKWVISE